MNDLWNSIRTNPVRIGAILSAAIALLAHFTPDAPWPLVAGLIAAVLGTGEVVRSDVAPMSKVVIHQDDAPQGVYLVPDAEEADDA